MRLNRDYLSFPSCSDISGESKKLAYLTGCEIENIRPLFKMELCMYQSKTLM